MKDVEQSSSSSKSGDIPTSPTKHVDHLSPGDLIWNKNGKYEPYWPCMISYDPIEGLYKKEFTSRNGKMVYKYHVQYFGLKAQRGWSNSKILPYEGFSKYEHFVQSIQDEAKGKKNAESSKQISLTYYPQPRLKESFDVAVSEAENALLMTKEARNIDLTFDYKMPKNLKRTTEVTNGEISKKIKINGHLNGHNLNSGPVTSTSYQKYESYCSCCGGVKPDKTCNLCLKSFHIDCIRAFEPFEWDDTCCACVNKMERCFHCKHLGKDIQKCSNLKCDKYYHKDCLKKYPCADVKKFVCPLHTCLSCYNDSPNKSPLYKGHVTKCVICPTAYHNTEKCLAAGCIKLSGSSLICTWHFSPIKDKKNTPLSLSTIDWCNSCGLGGSIVCCDSCSIAYHDDCLDTELTSEKYICDDCLSRNHVRAGSIVWVKFGLYRWWPAQVVDVNDLPANILNMKHGLGQFPVKYFHTGEYTWTHRGRILPFKERHKGFPFCKPRDKKQMTAKFLEAVKIAQVAFMELRDKKIKYQESLEKMPIYKAIKTLKPIGGVQLYNRSNPQCNCDQDDDNPCGYYSSCVNRSMYIECSQSSCPAKDKCQNQVFQRCIYPSVYPKRISRWGWGLIAQQDIKAGEFVIEYVGDVIDQTELKQRLDEKHKVGDQNFYFLSLDKDRIIDAGPRGNFSRFMNHSCDPNCETQKWTINGDDRIGLFALKDIASGTELTFDYHLDTMKNEALKCLCGSSNCSGTIGGKNRNVAKPKADKLSLKKKKNKK